MFMYFYGNIKLLVFDLLSSFLGQVGPRTQMSTSVDCNKQLLKKIKNTSLQYMFFSVSVFVEFF